MWDPHTQRNKDSIEMVQRRAATELGLLKRNIFQRIHKCHKHTTTVTVDIFVRKENKSKDYTILLYKALNDIVAIPTDHLNLAQMQRRQLLNFYIPLACANAFRHSFFMDTIRHWNTLPQTSRVHLLESFKWHSYHTH